MGTPYYREDLADKGYKILQHWGASDRTQADDYPNGRYFVIEYNNLTSEWNYYLGPLKLCSLHGLFVF